ncbi:STAS domain-containing protein [candidate division KSB1 bacterium]|nr:STAS domain-containing protein [candidate division KSB1 bacterium]
MDGIKLSVEQTGVKHDISVIKVGGYIDTTTSAELENALETLLRNGTINIIIDLQDVDYISSAGWGIFISEIKGIREKGGDLKLVRMIPDVYEVFELLEFHYILKAFDSIDEAVADFDRTGKGAPTAPATDNVKSIDEARAAENTARLKESAGLNPGARVSDASERLDESVEEKIRKIIAEDPECGSIKIMKKLKSPKYGNVSINWFQVRRYLNQLELDTRKKRRDYFRHVEIG